MMGLGGHRQHGRGAVPGGMSSGTAQCVTVTGCMYVQIDSWCCRYCTVQDSIIGPVWYWISRAEQR
jgi:hypothetical protein